MRRRTLGRTGLEVSELGMGGLFVSSFGAAREEGMRAVRRALELRVNYVDTAPGYRGSEDVLVEIEAHEQLLAWVARGEVRLADWISHTMLWTDYERGFEVVQGKQANKVALAFS